MIRRWRVIAVYAPQVKPIGYMDAKGRWGGSNPGTIPSAAGTEFSFTTDAEDEVEAAANVMQSGFFLAGLSKEFGFVAKEVPCAE